MEKTTKFFFHNVGKTLDPNRTKLEYNTLADSLIQSHTLYPEIVANVNNFSEFAGSYINVFFSEYLKSHDLRSSSFLTESLIIDDKNLKKNEVAILLNFISQLKFSLFYAKTTIALKRTQVRYLNWEDDFDNCMSRETAEIFADDGNPWPEIQFIGGIPESFIYLVISCVHQATFCSGHCE